MVIKAFRDELNFLILSKQASISSEGDKSPCLILSDSVLMLASVIRLVITCHFLYLFKSRSDTIYKFVGVRYPSKYSTLHFNLLYGSQVVTIICGTCTVL